MYDNAGNGVNGGGSRTDRISHDDIGVDEANGWAADFLFVRRKKLGFRFKR